jgi:phytanoyl-CoA dioxygenase PhyH
MQPMSLVKKAAKAMRHPRLLLRKVASTLRRARVLPSAPDPRAEALAFFERNSFAEHKVDLRRLESFRAEYFPASGPAPWLDRADAEEQIEAGLRDGRLSAAEAEACRHWAENGYVLFERLIDPDLVERAWAAVEQALADGSITELDEKAGPEDPFPGRVLNAHVLLPEVAAVLRHPAILRWLQVLIGREPLPFQTIAFSKGSEQGEHGDSIHMTTHPLGYLVASWTACEDISPDSGPLIYYPGSHKLPYVLSHDVGIGPGEFKAGGYLPTYTAKYEPYMKELVRRNDLKPELFEPRKGDVFFWHANLIHGGSPRKHLCLSRKSIVSHYFFRGAVCYHDLAGELIDLRQVFPGA